ncbi:hypothetical protein N9L08_10460, partial [Rhodobacteraceae bacterium]|nr:hypothetical protein [Paracoccaceae bacterium]
LIILVMSGDFLVKGAVALSDRLGIPAFIVGLTIVAFGTSAPELLKRCCPGCPEWPLGMWWDQIQQIF